MVEWNNELRAKMIARAWKDKNFRKKLLENPKEVFKEYGVEIPGNGEMKVVSEDATHFYFVLPNSPTKASKLSELELENIAAGNADWQADWQDISVMMNCGKLSCLTK